MICIAPKTLATGSGQNVRVEFSKGLFLVQPVETRLPQVEVKCLCPECKRLRAA